MHDSSCGRSHHLCPEETGSQSCRRGAHVAATCYCSLPDSGRSGQEQPTFRTTSDWLRGRIRPGGWLSCICSAQLFLSGSAKIGETAILFAVKRVVDPSHGPIRGAREIASAILKAIPTRNRKAIAAQLFLVNGSQNQVGSSISMARTEKGLLRLKSGVTSDFRCLMGHVVQRG